MSAIPRDTHDYTPASMLDQPLRLSWANLEIAAFVLLMGLSIFAHLWQLDVKAMHHDESVTSWMAWRYYTGASGFTCAAGRTAVSYCYDPVYHGPSYYVLTLFSFFLFGDGEWQSRLPEAIAGILLAASAWMLRPYLGRRGTLIAATLLAFSPSLLYFARFSRHDGLIVLWALWMVIGFFRYIDTGQPRYLYLLGAASALAMATHELWYILFFLFGSFVLIRVLSELLDRRKLMIGLAVTLALALIVIAWDPAVTTKLRGGGLALLLATVVGIGLLMVRVWDDSPRLSARAIVLWRSERTVLWTALGILAAVFVLLYSNFFTDPPGILDGLYQGLAYWLGSQHEFARGKQPWYYYLMQLPVYEPIALLGSISAFGLLATWGRERLVVLIAAIGAAIILFISNLLGVLGMLVGVLLLGGALYLFISGWWRGGTLADARAAGWRRKPAPAAPTDPDALPIDDPEALASADPDGIANGAETSAAPVPALAPPTRVAAPLFPLFLAFWFIGALVAFSWAGEKMPWLTVHIALPGNLLAAWAIGRILDFGFTKLDGESQFAIQNLKSKMALVPAALTLLLVALGVALWRIASAGDDQAGQAAALQAIIPLLIAGGLLFGILTIGQQIGARATLALCGLTIFALLAAYTIRSTWLLVYDHPDTPNELLIYVQSTPDLPLIVNEIKVLAINQTRNNRSNADPVGGMTMPVIMDSGDAQSGEGSLAWPFQWYLRDFQRIESRNADFFRNATAESFQVATDLSQPEGDKQFAPVVLVSTPHVSEATRQALEENYTKRYDTKLNWWFPEGDLSGCDPRVPGYKRFYYSTATLARAKEDKQCQSLPIDTLPYEGPFAPLLWPFQSENFASIKNYLLYRQLPDPLRLDGREMQVWVRKDLSGGGGDPAGESSGGAVKLVAQAVIGSGPGAAAGQLDQPRGATIDAQGNLYVADMVNNRIQVFGPDGAALRTIGAAGSGEGQFQEPRGIAVDSQGNLYVADTWNARVQKFDSSGKFLKSWGSGNDIGNGRFALTTDGTEAGNAAAPLGFYGPRAIAVDERGNVYIADTGNKRVVVTDSEGQFLYQWGHAGNEPGAFNEPIGIAVDAQGNVYVADTWNGRVQVFARGQDGKVAALPQTTWRVPGWQPNTYDDPYIAAGPNGQIYASVPSRNQVLSANQNGEIQLRWGGKGTDTASLALPSGVAVAQDGMVYVVDRGNNRVLQFKMPDLGQ
jgi:uncharacterized protein (TIGR03663 family)